jgi:uncharacterized protein YbjT (DUF2867 family)
MAGIRLVAITGITGSQGGAAARQLLAAGWRVRGLSRHPQSAAAARLTAAGAEILGGDMSDPAAVARLAHDAHGLYAVTDFFRNGLAREVEQGRLLAEAAARAGIRHLVFPSVALAEQRTGIPYFDAKVAIEQHVIASGVPYTILRPAIFMEDLVERKYAPPMWWGTMRRTVGDDKRLYWIAVDDVGAIAAKIFSAPERHIGQAITLAGDCRSMAEARAVFARVTGKRPLAIPMPLWLIRRVVNADLVPMWQWLATHPVVADLEPARRILPEVKDMERWLLARTRTGQTQQLG